MGGARRGPLGPKFVSSYPQRLKLYGKNDPSWGHFIDSGDAFLLQGTNEWFNRVVSADAKWSLGLIANNWRGGKGYLAFGTSFTSIPFGSTGDYTTVNLDVHDIEFNSTLVAGNQVTVTINGISTPPVAYTNNHLYTMELIQQAVVTLLGNFGSGGWADVPSIVGVDTILRVIGPNAVTLSVTATVSGPGAPGLRVYATDWLAVVVSENPGAWSTQNNSQGTSGVAVGITNVDQGVAQRLTVSLSSALAAGQTLSMTINGVVVSTPFVTSNNQTVLNFCAAYVRAFANSSAVPVVSGGTNNLQYTLISPDSETQLTVTDARVTGTGFLPIVSSAVSLVGTPSNGTFNFVVYENTNFVSPDEFYLCTYAGGTDGLGNPTQLEYVVNGSQSTQGSSSPRVRVVVNPLFTGTVNGPTNVTDSNYQRWLTGGVDGSIPSTQQVVGGWQAFLNPEQITVRILINAGYTDPAVQQAMMQVASSRQDCFCVLDTPSDSQLPQDAANYRNNIQNIDSYWGAMYTPDILIYDQVLGARRYVPPSGIVAGAYAYNDKVAAEWYSPAGLNRGIIQQALGARYTYGEGDRDLLSSNQINAIRKYGPAWTIWGEYTLQAVMSALQSVAVVRLMITVMTEAAGVAAYSVFEPNNPYTWHRITTRMNAILAPIEQAQGIDDFYVQCDSSNNTPDIIDERVMLIALWIKPTLSALYIRLDGIVTRHSAVFSQEMALAKNAY